MVPKQAQSCLQVEEPKNIEVTGFHPCRKGRSVIVVVQTCNRCGRSFMAKRKRQRCPRCLGVLVTKATVLKA